MDYVLSSNNMIIHVLRFKIWQSMLQIQEFQVNLSVLYLGKSWGKDNTA